ncbi:MAG: DHHA1 domain-containing protein, partial [Chloroflexota bacterium]|nr:DHHA1 domain-containing protein [Chloroflexota bacterium]
TLATELEALNQQRQTLTAAAQAEAEQQLAAQIIDDPALYVVSSRHFLPGIVGLVAGKLSERFYRPVVVIEHGEHESRGSARSIREFDISQALDQVHPFMLRHGGHSRAAGFTVQTPRLADFTIALQEVAHRHLPDRAALRPTLTIDAAVTLDQITWGLQEQFTGLEPTGHENPPPLLLCRRCRVREARAVGARKHLRLSLDAGANGPVFDGVAFNRSEWVNQLTEGSRIDVVFQIEANEWQGQRRLQLNVQDLRIAE